MQLASIHGVALSLPSRFLSSSKDAAPHGESAAVSRNGFDEEATAVASPLATGEKSERDAMSEITTFMSKSIQFRNRVPLKEVMAAMHKLREAAEGRKQVVEPSGALTLVQCTGNALTDIPRAERAQLTREMWSLLNQTGIFLDTSHYNMLLSVKLMNEDKFSPTEFVSSMESKGVAPDRTTFRYLLASFCQMGDTSGALAILSTLMTLDLHPQIQIPNAFPGWYSVLILKKKIQTSLLIQLFCKYFKKSQNLRYNLEVENSAIL